MKKSRGRRPKWVKSLLSCVLILAGLILFLVLGLQIWLSTWKTYKNDEFGFSLKVPNGWDVKDPRKDTSDTQYVFDAGSILKIGDQNTDFSLAEDGNFEYKGNMLIYVYENPPSKKKGIEVIKIGADGVSKDFVYTGKNNAFLISFSLYNTDQFSKKLELKIIETLIVNSFHITKI